MKISRRASARSWLVAPKPSAIFAEISPRMVSSARYRTLAALNCVVLGQGGVPPMPPKQSRLRPAALIDRRISAGDDSRASQCVSSYSSKV